MNYKKILKACAGAMAFSGLVIIFSTIYPILSYEWSVEEKYPSLVSPLVDSEEGSLKMSGGKDLTQASNWFPGKETNKFSTNLISFYTITIPKLRIDSATVAIGGEDLSENLIQYPGSVNPGNIGNTVIFGHSILPQYFNPKNYLSIFSTLPTLSIGDLIYVNYDGVTYRYKVENTFEVKPQNLWVLEQDKDASHISLITCSPPGHPLKPKRLVVKAKLVTG